MFQCVLQGSTPLHSAIESDGEDMRMIDALLAKAEVATVGAKSVWVKLCSDREYTDSVPT